jgi:ketosteroid isomerase-like protein
VGQPALRRRAGNPSRGKAAFEEAAASITRAFDEVSFEDTEVIDAGDRVLVLSTFVVHGRGSGVTHRQPQGYVWTLRNGKAVRLEWFQQPRGGP